MPHLLLGLALSLLGTACKKDHEVGEPVSALDPSLTLLSPETAAWLPVGPTPVSGETRDVRAVRIDDDQVALAEGGSFSGQVDLERGINVVEVRATTMDGDELYRRHGVLAGSFASASGDVEEAAVVRLNQGGLDTLLAMAGDLVQPSLLEDSLDGINPIYEDSYGVFGWDAVTVTAVVDAVDFGVLQLQANPGNDRVVVTGSLPDLWVDAQAYGDIIGLDFDTDVLLWADAAEFSGSLELGVSGGMVDVELTDVSIELVGFGYDTSLLPGDIEAWILVDTLRTTIEEQVLAMVQDLVPGTLDDALAGLDLSFETELLSTPLSVAAQVARVGADGDGIELGLDLAVDMPDGELMGQGYLTAGDGEPFVDRSADLAAAISDDLMNRMLYEAWSAGIIALTMSTEDGSLDPFMLEPLHASQGSIGVRADLPPVIVERDGQLIAQAAELIIDLDTPDGEFGSHLQLAVALDAPLDLVYDDGEIELDLGDVAVDLMVRESDWGASDETVTQLVEEMLPIDSLLILLGAVSFPVPEISGLSLAGVEVARDQNGLHTSLTADLE